MVLLQVCISTMIEIGHFSYCERIEPIRRIEALVSLVSRTKLRCEFTSR